MFGGSEPQYPVLMHFVEDDDTIPLADVETIRQRRPDTEIDVYRAGHGINCDEEASFEPESVALAWSRSLEWRGHHGMLFDVASVTLRITTLMLRRAEKKGGRLRTPDGRLLALPPAKLLDIHAAGR